jgi:rubrerythrin
MARKFDPEELARGRAVEQEHVDEPSFAEEIARDHLREHPRYYTRLAECDVEGQGTARACPTCKRNPRPLPPEGYGYAFAMGVCPVCRWWRVMSKHVDPRQYTCAQCGHVGLMLVEDKSAEELEQDAELVLKSIRKNPRHKRWQSKSSRRPVTSYACAKCGEALAAPGSDLCRPCMLEEEQPDRCPDCGRRMYYDSRLRAWICPSGCMEY